MVAQTKQTEGWTPTSLPDDYILPVPRWLVEGLIRLGFKNVVYAMGGVGKSFWLDYLAYCVKYGYPFLGQETIQGNALILDSDTSTEVLEWRLKKMDNFFKEMGMTSKYQVFYESMKNLSYKNGLTSVVQKYQAFGDLKLVVEDSVSSMFGETDPDKTQSVSIMTKHLREIHDPDCTVMSVHHIGKDPTHKTIATFTPEHLMTCDDPTGLCMNSSRIITANDTAYLVASPTPKEAPIESLFIRSIGRRSIIPLYRPFSCNFIETETSCHFEMGETLNFKKELEEDEKLLIGCFNAPPERSTVKVLTERSGGMWSENTIRTMVEKLVKKGYVRKIGEGQGKRAFLELLTDLEAINRNGGE